MAPTSPAARPPLLLPLPWYHPRRLSEDAAAVAVLLVFAAVFVTSRVTAAARGLHQQLFPRERRVVVPSPAPPRFGPLGSVRGQAAARALLSVLSFLRPGVHVRGSHPRSRVNLGGARSGDHQQQQDRVPLVSSPSPSPSPSPSEEEEEEEKENEEEEWWRRDLPRGAKGTVTLPVRATGWPAALGKGQQPSRLTSTSTTAAARRIENESKTFSDVPAADEAAAAEAAAADYAAATAADDAADDTATFEMYFESYPAATSAERADDSSTPAPAPTVLLLNPTGGSTASWCMSGAVTHLQSRGYAVLLCDLRGQGRSGAPPPGPYSVLQLSLDVAALLRSLGIGHAESPVHVIGYSLGAAVALQLAVLDAAVFKTQAYEAIEAVELAEAAKTVEAVGAETDSSSSAGGSHGTVPSRDHALLQRWFSGRFFGGGGTDRCGDKSVGSHPSSGSRKTAGAHGARPLVRGVVLFGFTSSYLAGKSPLQRLCSDVMCSERFIKTLGVPAFGRLLAVLMGFNWRAIDDNGGYPSVAKEEEREEDEGEHGEGEGEGEQKGGGCGGGSGGDGGGGVGGGFRGETVRGGGGGGGGNRVVPVQRRRLNSEVLRWLMAKNKLDGFMWTVASWRGFDVSAHLPAITVRIGTTVP